MSTIDTLFTDSLFLLAPNYDSVQGKVVVGFGRFNTPPLPTGNGYLAGSSPKGLTKVRGAPMALAIRVQLRRPSDDPANGLAVTEILSNPDGTWRVNGLSMNERYDVIFRYEGYNDMIISNVQPVQM